LWSQRGYPLDFDDFANLRRRLRSRLAGAPMQGCDVCDVRAREMQATIARD
jgi:hypothetical protein